MVGARQDSGARMAVTSRAPRGRGWTRISRGWAWHGRAPRSRSSLSWLSGTSWPAACRRAALPRPGPTVLPEVAAAGDGPAGMRRAARVARAAPRAARPARVAVVRLRRELAAQAPETRAGRTGGHETGHEMLGGRTDGRGRTGRTGRRVRAGRREGLGVWGQHVDMCSPYVDVCAHD